VVTAAAEKNVVRITPRRPATTLRVIDFDRGKVRQSIRINPKELRPAGSFQGQQGEQLQFGLVLTGMATDDDFLGLVEVGGPGGDTFALNTNGLMSLDILEDLATQINQAGSFVATISDGMLLIDNVTPDNTFLVNFEDPELEVIIWVGLVPSTASSLW